MPPEPLRPYRRDGWLLAVRTGAALAAAIGIGRFVFTPILPLMEADAGLTSAGASILASANYLGYLLGALLGISIPHFGHSRSAMRTSSVVLTVSLLAMTLTHDHLLWSITRAIAGVASAIVFMVVANAILTQLSSARPQLVGWAYGGLGVGITFSGVLVTLVSDVGDWRAAWAASAVLTAVFAAIGWKVGSPGPTLRQPKTPAVAPTMQHRRLPFGLLMTSYVLEGAGYIIAGTFLVAAVAATGPGWLAGSLWIVVGLAVVPSCVLWASMATRFSRPTLLTVALVLQATGLALPAFSDSPLVSLAAATLFGATFMGVVTLSMSIGRSLGVPKAVALLTAGYSIGQVVGPLAVVPLLHNGYHGALLLGAAIVLAAAVASALLVAQLARTPRLEMGGPVTRAFARSSAGNGRITPGSPRSVQGRLPRTSSRD